METLIALGATVIGLDLQPTERSGMTFLPLDLRDAGAIAEAAAAIDAPIDALFNCAGVSQSTGLAPIDVMRVNFIGTRALTEALLPRIASGGAVASIASSAGWGWRRNLEPLRELIATKGEGEAEDWVCEHADLVGKGYNLSKEAVVLWTMASAARTIARGVRMNCICPGPVDTPMLDGIIADIGMGKVNAYAWPIGRLSRPEEQAAPLIFLNSGAASYSTARRSTSTAGCTARRKRGSWTWRRCSRTRRAPTLHEQPRLFDINKLRGSQPVTS